MSRSRPINPAPTSSSRSESFTSSTTRREARSIARPLVEDSVYGVTPYEVSSSSSSPLYAFLLAAANSVFGVREIIPLVVNVLSALVLFVIAHRILRAHLHSQLAGGRKTKAL